MSSNTSPAPQIAPLAVSIDDACRILGIGKTKLHEEINANRLTARKVGAKTLIPTKQFPGWLENLPRRPKGNLPDYLRNLPRKPKGKKIAGADEGLAQCRRGARCHDQDRQERGRLPR